MKKFVVGALCFFNLINASVTVVVGLQWGDEGKGKMVHCLGKNADMVVRCQGGNNAGHTVITGG